MKWIKLWPDEWLNGTLRFTLDHKKRAVWADLLCLGGKSRIPGIICAGEESGKYIGYPIEHLAGITLVAPEELSEILGIFESQGRVTVERENGRLIIRLLNWSKYQVEYSRQSRYKAKQKRLRQQVTSKGDAKGDARGDGEVEVEVEVEEEVDQKKRRFAPAATAKAAQPVAFQSDLLIVNQLQDAKLADTYPWVDRQSEYKKMALWREAHQKGKTKNTLAFCQNWFNRIPCPSNGGGVAKSRSTVISDAEARRVGAHR